MKTLLIGTSNPGKLDEIKKFLSGLPIRIVNLSDLHICSYPSETGNSFKENAIIKAKFYSRISGLPTIGDDGGFEIDALNGEPGVISHRWVDGNRESTDEELIKYTISRMKNVPDGKRGAQLHLVMAYAFTHGQVHTAEALVRGVIPMKPSNIRTEGYPFRSLLYIPEIGKFYDHKFMTEEEMLKYNHRGKAIADLTPVIRKTLGV